MAAVTAGGIGRTSDLGVTGLVVLGAAVVVALFLVSAPLAMLFTAALRGPSDYLPFEAGASWTLAHLAEVYADPVLYTRIIPDTAIYVVGAVTLSFITAFALAWLIERTDLPAGNMFFTLILFPLLVPGVILAIAWIYLFGPNAGWINLLLRDGLGLGTLDIFTFEGLIACQAAASVPFIFLLLSAALRTMNPALEEASAASGASPFATFRRVTLPVLRPGILAPLILATLITLEQFEMPLIIGLPARVNVFSTRIFFELNPDSGLPVYGRAAAVALPFLMMGIALLVIYNHLIRRAEHFVTITGRGYRPARFRLGAWRWPALAFVLFYVGIAGVLPALVLVWTSLIGYTPPSLAALGQISLDGYRALFADPTFYGAVGNTFLVAGLSAAIVTLLGAMVAWVVVRTRFPGRPIVDFMSFMSIGIPSVIAGLAAMILYLSLPIGIYGTVWILVLAYAYRLAVTTRLSRAGLMQVHRELEEASYASGGAWWPTVRRVALPLLKPSLVASFVLLFIIGFREFTLAMVLFSPENQVLSVILWRLFEGGEAAKSAAVAVMVVLFVVPVIFLARRMLLPSKRTA